jgi:hypothetical protein
LVVIRPVVVNPLLGNPPATITEFLGIDVPVIRLPFKSRGLPAVGDPEEVTEVSIARELATLIVPAADSVISDPPRAD